MGKHLKKTNNMKNGFFRRGGLLVAGPTAGKTFAQSKWKKEGTTVIDTDQLTEKLVPNFFSDKLYQDRSKTGMALMKMRDLAVADEIILRHPDDLVLTNLWAHDFLRQLLGPNKPQLYVGVADWKIMCTRSKARGHALSEGLCRKWQNDIEVHVPNVFQNFIFLNEDQHLTDVVAVVKGAFMLTKLGTSLLNARPVVPGPFHQVKEKGGSHDS